MPELQNVQNRALTMMSNNITNQPPHATKTENPTPSISLLTFGEETSIPLRIQNANVTFPEHNDFLRRTLVNIELTVVNDTVPKAVSAKLRLSLPLGATVTKFEFFRPDETGGSQNGGTWYPAVAVPKKKAKAVVYKEKERGRDVAAVSDVASGSNVFEMELSPLPYKKEARCRLECVFVGDLTETKEFVQSCFGKNSAMGEEETSTTSNDITLLTNGSHTSEKLPLNGTSPELEGGGGAVVGKCFGKTHFVCRVPPLVHLDSSGEEGGAANTIRRIAIIWDTSGSMIMKQGETTTEKNPLPAVEKRCERLAQLACKCNEDLHRKGLGDDKVVFELYTFNVGPAKRVGNEFDDVFELISAIRMLQYDGGTDVTPLTELFANLAQRHKDQGKTTATVIDAALIFSDGMDSLGRLPPDLTQYGVDPYDVKFPVHCVADGKEANWRCLRALSLTSPHFQGMVLSEKDVSYVPAVLLTPAMIRSITTDQSEDALVQEVDDGFRCVPDYRRGVVDQVVGVDGAFITGILDDPENSGTTSTVSKIVANVVCGREVYEFCFNLRESDRTNDDEVHPSEEVSHPSNMRRFIYQAREFGDETSARLLGHLYARALYDEVEADGLKSGMDLKRISEELSLEYGFCSPESTLLMLYDMDQFEENDICPPKDHPLYEDDRAVKLRRKQAMKRKTEEMNGGQTGQRRRPSNDDNDKEESREGDEEEQRDGSIGGQKTSEQREGVLQLWKDMAHYFEPSPQNDFVKVETFGQAERPSQAPMFGQAEMSACSFAGRVESYSSSFDPREGGPAGNWGWFQDHVDTRMMVGDSMARDTELSQARSRARESQPVSPRESSLARFSSTQIEEACYDDVSCIAACLESCSVVPEALDMMGAQPPMVTLGAPSPMEAAATLPPFGSTTVQPPLPAFGSDRSVLPAEVPPHDQTMHVTSSAPFPNFAQSAANEGSITPCKDPKTFEASLHEALQNNNNNTNGHSNMAESWESEYMTLRNESDGGTNATSPSFFLTCARVAKEHNKFSQAIRIASNCLEINIEDVQMLRCAAYFLLSVGGRDSGSDGESDEIALDLALAIFDRIEDLQPCEPQSYLDGAFARYLRAAHSLHKNQEKGAAGKSEKEGATPSSIRKDLAASQRLICRVLTHQWAPRFHEVEWPALLLLHYVADLIERFNGALPPGEEALDVWPLSDLSLFRHDEKDESHTPLKYSNFNLALMVWMGWDTDMTDIDLHILEPTQNEVYYGNRDSRIGGHLSRDFTEGYGPEVYILKEPVVQDAIGDYHIYAKYFASHQDSVLTGTTSVVLWTIEKNWSCEDGFPKIEFHHVRLNTHQSKTEVGMVKVEG